MSVALTGLGSGLLPFVSAALCDAIGAADSIGLLHSILMLVFSSGCYVRLHRLLTPRAA